MGEAKATRTGQWLPVGPALRRLVEQATVRPVDGKQALDLLSEGHHLADVAAWGRWEWAALYVDLEDRELAHGGWLLWLVVGEGTVWQAACVCRGGGDHTEMPILVCPGAYGAGLRALIDLAEANGWQMIGLPSGRGPKPRPIGVRLFKDGGVLEVRGVGEGLVEVTCRNFSAPDWLACGVALPAVETVTALRALVEVSDG